MSRKYFTFLTINGHEVETKVTYNYHPRQRFEGGEDEVELLDVMVLNSDNEWEDFPSITAIDNLLIDEIFDYGDLT